MGILDSLTELLGGGAPPAPDLLGTGVPAGPVSSTVTPSTSVSSPALPGNSPQVLAKLRTDAPAINWKAGVKNYTDPLAGLADMKVAPGDKVAAFAQGFGSALKAGAAQAAAEAKAAREREETLRKRANDFFDQDLKTKKEAREARDSEEKSEAGGAAARRRTGAAAGLTGDKLQRYTLTGDPDDPSKTKTRNYDRDMAWKQDAINKFKIANGLKADDNLRSTQPYSPYILKPEERAAKERELQRFIEDYERNRNTDEDAPLAPKAGDIPAKPGNTPAVPAAAAPAAPGAVVPPSAAPVIPTAPAPAAPAAGAATPAPPRYVRNPATGEVREWDPNVNTYVPSGKAAPPP